MDADIVVDVGRRFMKKGGHTQLWHARKGGPVSVRARKHTLATRHRATVGRQTLHFAVSESTPAASRYEEREWHAAKRMGPHLRHLASNRDVWAAAMPHDDEFRRVPTHGELPCDSELDVTALSAALPDDVLRLICKEHAAQHLAMDAAGNALAREHAQQSELRQLDRLQQLAPSKCELRVRAARFKLPYGAGSERANTGCRQG